LENRFIAVSFSIVEVDGVVDLVIGVDASGELI
jgi:hypothetical protein